MNKSYFNILNIEDKQKCLNEIDSLSMFRIKKEKPTQIRHGMNQNEIAEVISDKLIDYIKAKFDEVDIKKRERSIRD